MNESIVNKYAVVLYFDSDSSALIKNIIRQFSETSGNKYMLDVGIPPHVSLGCFEGESEEKIISVFDDFAENAAGGDVTFEKADGFKPKVIFLSPIKNKYLTDLNETAHKMFLEDFKASEAGNYLPERWVPHCSLCVRLNEEQYEKTFIQTGNISFPIRAYTEKIVLARCDPYTEIKTVDI